MHFFFGLIFSHWTNCMFSFLILYFILLCFPPHVQESCTIEIARKVCSVSTYFCSPLSEGLFTVAWKFNFSSPWSQKTVASQCFSNAEPKLVVSEIGCFWIVDICIVDEKSWLILYLNIFWYLDSWVVNQMWNRVLKWLVTILRSWNCACYIMLPFFTTAFQLPLK